MRRWKIRVDIRGDPWGLFLCSLLPLEGIVIGIVGFVFHSDIGLPFILLGIGFLLLVMIVWSISNSPTFRDAQDKAEGAKTFLIFRIEKKDRSC